MTARNLDCDKDERKNDPPSVAHEGAFHEVSCFGEHMKMILQVEYSPSLLAAREEVLKPLGCSVKSILGSRAARDRDLRGQPVGVIIIGHGAPWEERRELIRYFQEALPRVPSIALLRRSDKAFSEAAYNCRADDPPLWVKTVSQALASVQ
jgi:hypothetical protein